MILTMCQSKSNGGVRCANSFSSKSKKKSNERKRNKYHVNKITNKINAEGEEWVGTIPLNITSPLIAQSLLVAVQSHKGVKRISGESYINHPLRVSKYLQDLGFNDDVVSVALLHDAVEDSELTLDDLRDMGFNERIVTGVDSVSKRNNEPYVDAVARAISHPIGRLVKLSDNLDNSSEEQLIPLSQERRERVTLKYTLARGKLYDSLRSIPDEKLYDKEFSFTSHYKLNENGLTSKILGIVKS